MRFEDRNGTRNDFGNQAIRLDLVGHAPLEPVPIGDHWTQLLALDPTGSRAALVDLLAGNLRILDLARTAGASNEHWQVADWNIGNLAQAFENAGDRSTAARLYLDALRLSPQNWSWAERLAELDPAGGLAVLRELEAAGQHEGLETSLARMLAGGGNLDEALELLRDEDGDLQGFGWDLFLEHDPEAAEAALKAAALEDDPFAELGLRYARVLIDGERTEEALAELERLLAAHPDNPEIARLLADLSPERGLELAAAEVLAHPDSAEGWSRYADLLAGTDRTEEALEARLRAFELSDSTWIPGELLEAMPDRVLPLLQERADRSTNDELWGDLADSYWRAGRHEQAKAAWLRARTLDSDDGEWSGKLDKLEQGIDPLGEANVNFTGGGYLGGWGGSSIELIEDVQVLGY